MIEGVELVAEREASDLATRSAWWARYRLACCRSTRRVCALIGALPWTGAAPAPPPGPRPVPVSVAAARIEDVPVYLSGIGAVQAYNTLSVRSRIDGENP